jgi:predicted amidohydrolase YtcJ
MFGAEDFEKLLARRAEATGPRLNADAIKIFVDGVLEGETAALLTPYLTKPGYTGSITMPAADLNAAVTRFDVMGLQVHMHAIGDAAVRAGLDAFAAARAKNGPSDHRHHISHLQLIDPADIPRFKELGVTANFQSFWAWPDDYILKLNMPQVGPERVNRMYPIGSVHRAGGRIVGGSDWSVSTVNPLPAIQVAMTRQDPDGVRTEVLNEAERVDLPTMIAAYTIEGAWLMHHETDTGSIETGKAADIVVLEKDLFKVAPREIGRVRVDLTMLDGEVLYRRPAASARAP